MKWIAKFLTAAVMATLAAGGLTGCASDSDPVRARNIAKARTELAAAYYQRTQYRIALEELEKSMRADSDYAPAYNVRGLVNMALREDSDAESDFRRSLRLDPEYSDAHNNYGWFLCQHGHEADAVKHFVIAAKDPMYATPEKAYLNAGLCSKKAGQPQAAMTYLQRALILQPGMPEALLGMADVSFSSGDYPSAKSYFRKYEKAGVTLTAEALLLGVRIERKLNNRAGEQEYAARLRKNYPESRETFMLGQIR